MTSRARLDPLLSIGVFFPALAVVDESTAPVPTGVVC